jgi:hypothetical protein
MVADKDLLPVTLIPQRSITPISTGTRQIGIVTRRARYPVSPLRMNIRERTKKQPANIMPGIR